MAQFNMQASLDRAKAAQRNTGAHPATPAQIQHAPTTYVARPSWEPDYAAEQRIRRGFQAAVAVYGNIPMAMDASSQQVREVPATDTGLTNLLAQVCQGRTARTEAELDAWAVEAGIKDMDKRFGLGLAWRAAAAPPKAITNPLGATGKPPSLYSLGFRPGMVLSKAAFAAYLQALRVDAMHHLPTYHAACKAGHILEEDASTSQPGVTQRASTLREVHASVTRLYRVAGLGRLSGLTMQAAADNGYVVSVG